MTTTTTHPAPGLDAVCHRQAPITLAELDARAALQTRRDRKYLVPATTATGVLAERPNLAVLEIDGLRHFRYRSLYFDTPDLAAYRGAAAGRRRRFKVRLRWYDDQQHAVLEVKTKSGRGETVKQRIDAAGGQGALLSAEGRDFVDTITELPGLGASLQPVLWTAYTRSTLVDLDDDARITIDVGLRVARPGGEWTSITDDVVMETKAAGSATTVDRTLWAIGQRPVSISKFAVGMALSDATLPANHWHRVLPRLRAAA